MITYDLPRITFTAVGSLLDTFCFTIKEIDNLSCDQRFLLEYTVGVSRGKMDPTFAEWKTGPLNQARWLTSAIRLMCLWTWGSYPQAYLPNFIALLSSSLKYTQLTGLKSKGITTSIISNCIFSIWSKGLTAIWNPTHYIEKYSA